jgi:DNA-binding XRE family transcriptional regulator
MPALTRLHSHYVRLIILRVFASQLPSVDTPLYRKLQAFSNTLVLVTLAQAFGLVVKDRRISAGLSQEELAFEAGMHPVSISFMERGLRAPTIHSIFAIAGALKADPAQLIADVTALKPKME